ncbi:unnamed protein product [Blepharisma stoltei]|uniref:Uncharacterized protein n=1 Tax=Blepharisma stoltei TaxID=1481888 RepID=A0AAU9KD96_9CILI|nr:unnamed protein product [Blepharisma stoltei]
MGSNWSWPCGDRERRRYKVTTAKPKSDINKAATGKFNIIRAQAIIVPAESIERILKIHPKDNIPSWVISNPRNLEEVIIVSQHPDDLATFSSKQGNYMVSLFAANENNWQRLSNLLENSINVANSINKTFIGAITDSSGRIFLCYFKHNHIIQGNSKFIVKLIDQPLTGDYLKELLNDYKGIKFKGCIKYKEKSFLILEEPKNTIQKAYVVNVFSNEEIGQPGFIMDVSNKIEIGVGSQGLEFVGMASITDGIALVFSKK